MKTMKPWMHSTQAEMVTAWRREARYCRREAVRCLAKAKEPGAASFYLMSAHAHQQQARDTYRKIWQIQMMQRMEKYGEAAQAAGLAVDRLLGHSQERSGWIASILVMPYGFKGLVGDYLTAGDGKELFACERGTIAEAVEAVKEWIGTVQKEEAA